MKKMKVEDVS
jgi:hypothetical protein